MLVDIFKAPELDGREFSSLPVLSYKAAVRWRAGEVDIRLLSCPQTYSLEDLIYVQCALVASVNGKDKVCVSLELENLRAISVKSGESLRSLQKDYGTKGYLVSPRIMVYAAGEREDYGNYADALSEDELVPLLLDILLDVIDSGDDLVRL